ncbi:MAG TPA: phosphotransferase [Gaiellaceae bacterium]|nr:phosphotransferase [Gaiellaceae bacterium]
MRRVCRSSKVSAVGDQLVAAAVSAARRAGIEVTDPVVLHERHGLIVQLGPAPVVARVERTASIARSGLDGANAVAFAAFLTEVGASVVRSLGGPLQMENGVVVTLWALLETSGPLDPAAAGASLRDLHDRATGYAGRLRSFDPRPDALALCEALAGTEFGGPIATIRRAVERLELPERLGVEPIHGDAHLGNVIQTSRGPIWIDLEDVCRGPREWDLACLLHRGLLLGQHDQAAEAALESYGKHDREAVDELAAAVMVWIAPWAVYADSLDGTLNDWTRRRLDWLEQRFR